MKRRRECAQAWSRRAFLAHSRMSTCRHEGLPAREQRAESTYESRENRVREEGAARGVVANRRVSRAERPRNSNPHVTCEEHTKDRHENTRANSSVSPCSAEQGRVTSAHAAEQGSVHSRARRKQGMSRTKSPTTYLSMASSQISPARARGKTCTGESRVRKKRKGARSRGAGLGTQGQRVRACGRHAQQEEQADAREERVCARARWAKPTSATMSSWQA